MPDQLNAEKAAPRAAFSLADHVAPVTIADVFDWLRAGWRDFRAAGWVSPAYGLIFVVIGFAITGGLILVGMPYLITPMIGGFLLIAPLLAVGFYDMSRRLQTGEAVHFWCALTAFRRNSFHMLTAGLVLMLFLMIWARLAVLIFALSFPYKTMSLANFTAQLATPAGITFAVVGAAVGGALAALAYVATVVSLPLMLDRKTDFFSAAAVSVLAVARNPRPLAVWAALIALIIFAGFAAGFVGLVIALPVIGHASWHAYRRLVRAPPA